MPKKTPTLRKPQEVTAQSKFKMSSDELSAHYKKHFPLAKEFELAQACSSILEAVGLAYKAEEERIQLCNYQRDLQLKKLKTSL
jgi:hypothetical protein